jgi:hypothetical protein
MLSCCPGSYSTYYSCSVPLYSGTLSPVVFLLSSFSSAFSGETLFLYDGSNSGYTQIAAISYDMPSQVAYVSSGSYMDVVFSSSSYSQSARFFASIMVSSTFYMSPNGCPGPYEYVYLYQYNTLKVTSQSQYNNNMNCAVIIYSSSGSISLSFASFQTEGNCDFVNIYDGSTAYSTSLAHISGSMSALPLLTYTSSGSYMYVQFTSDYSNTYSGFTAVITAASPSATATSTASPSPGPMCGLMTPVQPGGTIQASFGTLSWDQSCSWLITAQNTFYALAIDFTALSLVGGATVTVYDGDSNSVTTLATLTSSATSPQYVSGTQTSMLVVLVADAFGNAGAFTATTTEIIPQRSPSPSPIPTSCYGQTVVAAGDSISLNAGVCLLPWRD